MIKCCRFFLESKREQTGEYLNMNIVYNNLNINNCINYWVEDAPHETPAKAEINLQKIARSNESVILKKGYGIRTIKMTVIIEDSSIALLDARVDEFKQYMEAVDKNLDMDYSTGTRRYVCSGYVESVERKPRWARATVRFECYKAFGEDTETTSEDFSGKTTQPITDDIDIGGNAPAKPDITITINTVTPGAGDKFVQIKNLDTGDYVKVIRDDFTAGDIIIIYTVNAMVLVNGNVTPYLGIMPVWSQGINNWEYSDDFSTARNVDIQFDYKKKWL